MLESQTECMHWLDQEFVPGENARVSRETTKLEAELCVKLCELRGAIFFLPITQLLLQCGSLA